MWNCRVGLALVILLTAAMAWAQAPPTTSPSDAEIRQILADPRRQAATERRHRSGRT